MRKLIEKISKILTSLVIVVSLVACGGGGTSTVKETLNIGVTNTMSSLNPIAASDVVAQWVAEFIYPTLLTQPQSSVFEPNLSALFETEDNQTFTINLNEDAVWSDGVPITADDVAYTLTTIATPGVETSRGSAISSLEGLDESNRIPEGSTELSGITIIDDKTLTLTTKAPVDIDYLSESIGFNIKILPKHVLETMDLQNLTASTFGTAPTVFGGAYKFVKYEQGSYIQLEANENYFKGAPNIKTIFIRIVDGTALVTGLQSGEIDMSAGGGIGVIAISDYLDLKANFQDTLKVEGASSENGQFMNINNNTFDQNIRLAMTHAINRERIVAELLQGEGEVLPTSYTSTNAYRDFDMETLAYDPELAKTYLAQSSWDPSVPIRLSVPTGNKIREASANLIEQDLEAIGLIIEQESFDFATHLANSRNNDFDLALMGLSLNSDPDQSNSWSTHGSSSYGFVGKPELDELWRQGVGATNREDRQKIYSDIQYFMRDQAITVGLYSNSVFIAQTNKLNGGVSTFWKGTLANIETWTIEA